MRSNMFLSVALLLMVGCGEAAILPGGSDGSDDTGATDGGTPDNDDSGTTNGGWTDGGTSDGGSDGGTTGDGGTTDGGTSDGGGTECVDADDDGFCSVESGGSDCDDLASGVNPGVADDTCNGLDEDCDGADGNDAPTDPPVAPVSECSGATDDDGDGVFPPQDCDNGNVDVHPGATEACNGIDDDCDGSVDEDCPTGDGGADTGDTGSGDGGTTDGGSGDGGSGDGGATDGGSGDGGTSGETDSDGDGWSVEDGDCNDSSASAHPGAVEIPYDGIDQDCDGTDPVDEDCDGYAAEEAGGDDCDDGSDTIHPGAVEVPNDGIDQDCDGADLVAMTDADGDGWSVEAGDCNDVDDAIHPGAAEVLDDGIDQDCDGADLEVDAAIEAMADDDCNAGDLVIIGQVFYVGTDCMSRGWDDESARVVADIAPADGWDYDPTGSDDTVALVADGAAYALDFSGQPVGEFQFTLVSSVASDGVSSVGEDESSWKWVDNNSTCWDPAVGAVSHGVCRMMEDRETWAVWMFAVNHTADETVEPYYVD